MSYGDYLRNKYHHAAVKIADAEGVPCVLEYSKGKNIRNYEIYGNSVQDGTPSPESPVEIQSVGDLTTKNLLPNSDWMSGSHATGFTEQTGVDYITEYTQNSISFNLAAWKGVSSPRFKKGSVKRIVFKINQNQINSDDGYVNFYIIIQGYDDNNNKVGNQTIYNNAVADTEYIFDFSTIASYDFYAKSTQFSFCILSRKNVLSNLMVYDIAYYSETDTTEYEPYHKYDIPITVTGKNLLKYPYYWTSRVRSGIMFTVNEDGTITLSGTTTLTGTAIDDFTLAYETKIKSGTYTVSGCPEGGAAYKYRIFLHIKDSNGNPTYISDIGNGATFTITSTSTMTVSIRIGAEIGTVNNLVFAPQIELGSTATEYESYKGNQTTHIYLDEPLRKVGDYADYIDFKNQKIVRNAAKATLNGSETWTQTANTSEGVYQGFALSNSAYNIPKGNNLVCFSDKFPYLSSAVEKNTIRMEKNSAYTLRIIIGAEYVPDLELSTFKTWLSTNNVKIVYPLAAPTEESIALPALKTFKGKSIISADTTVLPSNIKVKYVRT